MSDYLSSGDLQFMQDYADSAPVPYSLPSFGTTDTGGSGFNFDSFGRLIQTGVKAYGDIRAIDHGSAQGSYYPPAAQDPAQDPAPPAAAPPAAAPASAFDWAKFKDFSTPYPYAAIVGGLLVLTVAITLARRR